MQQPQEELQLADIHMPAKPSAWPPAPGWWILAALLLALIALLLTKYLHYRKLKRQQKLTLQALAELEKKLQKGKTPQALAAINILLRRLALMHYPRKDIASLTGKEWLAFLDHSGQTKDFTQGAGRLLADAPYLAKMPESADYKGLTKAIKKWVTQVSIKDSSRKIRKAYSQEAKA